MFFPSWRDDNIRQQEKDYTWFYKKKTKKKTTNTKTKTALKQCTTFTNKSFHLKIGSTLEKEFMKILTSDWIHFQSCRGKIFLVKIVICNPHQ